MTATPTPTLDPERTDRLRTFLVTEAAASVATAGDRPSVLAPTRRRIVVGAATAALLAGGLVAVQSVGGSAPAAIAIEVEGEWTTITIADIDADPDAVVQQLIDAGFDARREPLVVLDVTPGGSTVVAEQAARDAGVSVVGFADADRETGAHGLVGLSVTLPGPAPAPVPAGAPDDATPIDTDPVEAQATEDGILTADEELLAAGVRFEPDGGVSIRSGTEATIIVHTEE